MILALPTYCCTHRVVSDAGNRLQLFEGEVDFICQDPNLKNYPLLTSQPSRRRTTFTRLVPLVESMQRYRTEQEAVQDMYSFLSIG
jgi:hypothetical protein